MRLAPLIHLYKDDVTDIPKMMPQTFPTQSPSQYKGETDISPGPGGNSLHETPFWAPFLTF